MKIYDKKLAYPYFVWMILFTVVPLLIVVYYAFTDGNGALPWKIWLPSAAMVRCLPAACCWPSSPRSSAWCWRSPSAIFSPACG